MGIFRGSTLSGDALANIDIVADNIDNVNNVGTNIANVNTVAGDIADVSTVAGIAADVSVVAGISSDVSAVENIAANVTSVAGNATNINAVAGNSTNINAVAGNATNINAVNANSTNINTVATNIANVNSVGANIANVNSVASNSTNINTVATDIADITTVAADIADVSTVAGSIVNVNAVAGIDQTDLGDVAAIAANVTTVAGIAPNVTTVAGISSNVTSVAGNATNINAVAGNNTNITAVAGNATNINAVAGNATNINAVAGNSTNINTVAGISANVTTVATNNANVTTVATNIASVNTNATNIANINQNAANITAIQNASANATAAANSATAAATSATNAATSAAQASAVALGNEPVRHSVRPSLLLDFANTKTLDPRITFTRASTATFYDGKTVAKAEENLILGSETFDSAAWSKVLTTVTANSTTAPDGNTTAETLTGSAGSAYIIQALATTSGLSYTFSVFAKANTTNFLQLAGGAGVFGTNVWANFDLSAGTVGSVGSLTTASIQSVGSGWYRCVMTGTATASASANAFGIVLVESGSATRFPTNAGTTSIYAWGAQLEQRSSVTAYTPTTTAPITNYIPALQTAASGVARFEHNPVTGESLGLEIEEQRTNLLTYSEQFDDVYWFKTACSITANTIVAPNGTLTGDKVIGTGVNPIINNSVGITTTAQSYTFSLYAKKGELNWFRLTWNTNATYTAWFDLNNGVTGTVRGGTATITSIGNGWYRCAYTFTATAATQAFIIGVSNANDITSGYTGDGYSGIYIWGAQLEAGSFATSYIKTEGSQVTRSADSASMTGTNFSSWYRADEGTVYMEAVPTNITTTAQEGFLISDRGVSASQIYGIAGGRNVGGGGGQSISFWVTQISNQAFLFTANSVATANTAYKIAGTYKVNDFAASFNGASASTDTSGITPLNMDRISWGNVLTSPAGYAFSIKKFAFYPKRLTNAELVSLSTI